MAILISDKNKLPNKRNITGQKDNFLMIKWSMVQDDLTILNVYAPNKTFKKREAQSDRTARRNKQVHNYCKISNPSQ